MRVPPEGNLTVALIRQARFEVVAEIHRPFRDTDPCPSPQRDRDHARCPVVDRVRLSDEACTSCDAVGELPGGKRSSAVEDLHPPKAVEVARQIEPATESITPVVGSPALAGLGVSLIVPGTLLDVVA